MNALLDVFLNRSSAGCIIHQITPDEQALLALLFNCVLRVLRILLFFWQEGNGDICTFAGKLYGNCAFNARANGESLESQMVIQYVCILSVRTAPLRDEVAYTYSPPVISAFFPFNFPAGTYSTKPFAPSKAVDSLVGFIER